VRFIPKFHPASAALGNLFARGAASVPLCNDTACGVGFAPLSPLENAVLSIEKELNTPATHQAHPAIGYDIKVMGVRRDDHAQFAVSSAMIDRHLDGLAQYREATEAVRRIAQEVVSRFPALHSEIAVNLADDYSRGSVYLTVTGTSADSGDDGEAGRGNRTSGLITPFRPMAIESSCGKNPVSHAGKLYNVAAGIIARRIAESLPGIVGATCVLVSQIGRPIDDPRIAHLRLALARGQSIEDVRQSIHDVVREELSRLPNLRDALLQQTVALY